MANMDDKPWYGSRPVLNPLDIIKWVRENGFKKCYAPTDMHVTFCYSKEFFSRPDYETPNRIYLIPTKEHRGFEVFGENKDTNVITFMSDDMTKSHNLMRKHGASFDFPTYTPHISFSNEVHDSPKAVVPYYGPIVLGKEKWDVVKSDWKPKEVEEAASAPLMPIDLAEFMATAMTCKTCKTLVSGIKTASDKNLWSKCLAYAEKKMNQYPKGYSTFYAAKLYTDKGGKC